VPLAPDELLTLGGDVLEAHTATAKERAPEPGEEPILERERFEARVAELPPNERAAARHEHAAERREIERRRALAARHTYVLTRIHKRYAANAARHDVELGPAPPVSGGVGVPRGARGELPAEVAPAPENRLGVRFMALEPWVRGSECSEPKRFRWGKRWASEARAPRAVPLALDLPGAGRDPRLLREVLRRPLPELGITELAATPAPAPAPASSASSVPSARPEPSRGCSVAPSCAGFGQGTLVWLVLGLAAHAALRRSPRGATPTARRRAPR
jgi:hypothetical protein